MADEHTGKPADPAPAQPPPPDREPPAPVNGPSPPPADRIMPGGPPLTGAVPAGGFAEARPPAPETRVSATPPARPRRFFWGKKKQAERQAPAQVSTLREILETVVFVVVLVLLLKTFAAEAFVIPTGSMATTLLGYNKHVTCPMCGHSYTINDSQEADPQTSRPGVIVGGYCDNCRYHYFPLPRDISWSSGDRVLVAKFVYDTHLMAPLRHQIIVFKYPGGAQFGDGPVKDHVPVNFIKRLIGLPGETILIYYGKLYLIKGMDYQGMEQPKDPKDLWKREYMYQKILKPHSTGGGRAEPGQDLLTQLVQDYQREHGIKLEISIIRRTPEVMLAMRRLVYDNDHQAKDLVGLLPPRWAGARGTAWSADDSHGFANPGKAGDEIEWLRYHNILPLVDNRELKDLNRKPELITDFSAYNTYDYESGGFNPQKNQTPPHWVGDLMLEARVTVKEAKGQLWLELSKGIERFRARFDLATGQCTLYRVNGGVLHPLGDPKATAVSKPGDYRLRFANVDQRLTLWVNKSLPFGDGQVYDAPKERGPTPNDLQPASIGTRGAGVEVHELKIWRDTYYTVAGIGDEYADVTGNIPETDSAEGYEFWSDHTKWDDLRRLPALRMYVQPGHYLALGDNSPESSDSRAWGTVPERLLLGRALLVYYPFSRAGTIK